MSSFIGGLGVLSTGALPKGCDIPNRLRSHLPLAPVFRACPKHVR